MDHLSVNVYLEIGNKEQVLEEKHWTVGLVSATMLEPVRFLAP